MNTLLKALIVGMSAIGFAGAGLAAVAAETEPPAPATEHQSEVLEKGKGADAEGNTRRDTTGDREGMKGKNPPATEHQEKALKGEQESEDSSKDMDKSH